MANPPYLDTRRRIELMAIETMISTPKDICCKYGLTFKRFNALKMIPVKSTPQNVPSMFPLPPLMGAPPMMTAPIACSSIPAPVEACAAPRRDTSRMTAIPVMMPLVMKNLKMWIRDRCTIQRRSHYYAVASEHSREYHRR